MIPNGRAFVGIDVGGDKKGFHAVALRDHFFEKFSSTNPEDIVKWCVDRADVVAVDAPCRWSQSSSSRVAERDLRIAEKKIHSFATPTRDVALAHKKHFYDWVFNGEKLYRLLAPRYPLFNGVPTSGSISFETFPQAIVCSLAGKVVPAKPKSSGRRKVLRESGYDEVVLPNIDFVDAALCALTAEAFANRRTIHFGNSAEGFIVVPRPSRVSSK